MIELKKFPARGFSLIELMVVVLIIIIIAAVGYPSITHTLEERKLHKGVREVISTLQFARMQSIMKSRAHLVEVTPVDRTTGGFIQVWRSSSNLCPTRDAVVDADLVRALYLTKKEPPTTENSVSTLELHMDLGLNLAIPANSVGGPLLLCFKPDGKVYGDQVQPLQLSPGDAQHHRVRRSTAVFFLNRYHNDNVVGVGRRIVLPHMGVPRISELGL